MLSIIVNILVSIFTRLTGVALLIYTVCLMIVDLRFMERGKQALFSPIPKEIE